MTTLVNEDEPAAASPSVVPPSLLAPTEPSLSWRRRLAVNLFTVLAAALASLYVALLIAPAQNVSVFGQTVTVKVAPPDFSLSGPGILHGLDYNIPTVGISFPGFIRPVIGLAKVLRSEANGQAFDAIGHGVTPPGYSAEDVRNAFLSAWAWYFGSVVLIALALIVGVVLAVTGLLWLSKRLEMPPWWRWVRWRVPAMALAMVLVLAGGIGLSVHTALGAIANYHSINDIFGVPATIVPPPTIETDETTGIAILGDSVPAGDGLDQGKDPSKLTQVCQRSSDAYGSALATTLGLKATNLACSGATIANGLLDWQVDPSWHDGYRVIPQFSELEAMKGVKLIDINVGADDLDWSHIFQMCYAMAECDDVLMSAYFQHMMDGLVVNLPKLLTALRTYTDGLDHEVAVVINTYYDPLGDGPDAVYNCPSLTRAGTPGGMTAAKAQQVRNYLDQLNDVLRQGAKAFGYQVAEVNFTGHELCTPTPYVQGMQDKAAMHPTAAGQLMIAAAVQAALPANWSEIAAGQPKPSSPPGNEAGMVPGPTPSANSLPPVPGG